MEILEFFSFLGQEAALFIVSMLPIVELRGAVPLGAALGIPWETTLTLALLGNLLPVPLLILFGRKILKWLQSTKRFGPFFRKYEEKLVHKAQSALKTSVMGLCLFVAIPLPGTGAWSGALIAALLDIRMKYALPAIVLGVLIAGVLMTLGSYGFVSFLSGI
ncbi:MAG: small multidrug export protein [Clostridiales bacterium]|nr:small multidrug export protein [Clostridiales bacterium]